jgi:hypothetical protein
MLKTTSNQSLSIVLLCTFWMLVGCNKDSNNSAETSKTPVATTSSVPLRLWIVGRVSDPSLVERAWLTGSDQKLEIRVLTVDEFLSEKSCNCDVTLFPARLLGEMLDRKWLSKLPQSLNVQGENALQTPAAWTRQAAYGGEVWAVSMGASIPVTIVSPSAAEAASQATDWESMLKLFVRETPQTPAKIDPTQVYRAALVDRFFAIAGGLSQRAPDYGLLFDLQKMKPRLTEPEFVRAAEILLMMSQQASDPSTAIEAVAGDSSRAWTWLSAQSKPAIAIVAPTLLNSEAMKLTGGKSIRVPAEGLGWNTGSGLMASLSASCRQSTRATEMLHWLRQSETRQSLSPLIEGIEAVTPAAESDSAAWQARSLASEQAANIKIPSELRLPRAEEYRHALSDSLVSILSGDKQIADALADAATAWQTITEARGRELQRHDYEQSLGLTRD